MNFEEAKMLRRKINVEAALFRRAYPSLSLKGVFAKACENVIQQEYPRKSVNDVYTEMQQAISRHVLNAAESDTIQEEGMTEQSSGFEDALAVYSAALDRAYENGVKRKDVLDAAKKAVYDIPGFTPTPHFWEQTSQIVKVKYGIVTRGRPYKQAAATTAKPKMTLSDAIRKMAEAGFVPLGKYLEWSFNGQSGSISSLVSQIKQEGNFTFERNEWGWVTTPIIKRTYESVMKESEAAIAAGQTTKGIELFLEAQTLKKS